MMEIMDGLCYDDVLLPPQYSEIDSRSQVDVSVKIDKLRLEHPIVLAPMQSIMGREMIDCIINSGGLAILHRFMPFEEQLNIATDIIDAWEKNVKYFAVSLGVKGKDTENFVQFYQAGVRIFCIDIAHGDSKYCVDMIKELKRLHPDITLIAGNVATGSGARRLWEAGADIVRVGVGNGSVCSTRIQTGNGVPQLTALMDVKKVQQELLARDKTSRHIEQQRQYIFMADGGITSSGNLVKSLCLADLSMVGNLFAGCMETPSETHYFQGMPHKEYRGSSTHKTNHIEGVAAWVPCTGTFDSVLTKLLEGLRSGMSYQNAYNLEELKDNPIFIRITNAGLVESHPHSIIIK